MKRVVLGLALLGIAGTASAAMFVPPPSPPPAVVPAPPAKITAVQHPVARTAIATSRAPVPLHLAKRPAPIREAPSTTSQRDAASVMSLTEPPPDFSGLRPVPPPTPTRVSNSGAKASIERDGYRNVRDLTCSEGRCTGRASRGNTEISVTVEPDGSVRTN